MPKDASTEPVHDRRSSDQMSSFDTVIAQGVALDGSIHCDGNLDLRGQVNGLVEAGGLVWLRPGSRVHGDVVAAEVVVEGQVDGQVKVAGKVDLRPSARVNGGVVATVATVAEGSEVAGAVQVSKGGGSAVHYSERRQEPSVTPPEPSASAWGRSILALRRLNPRRGVARA